MRLQRFTMLTVIAVVISVGIRVGRAQKPADNDAVLKYMAADTEAANRRTQTTGSENIDECECLGQAPVCPARFSPDEQLPPGALTRLRTGQSREGAGITSLAFSLDGKLLASGSTESNLRVWEVASRKERFKITECGAGGVAFSPDGKFIVSTGEGTEATICLWDVVTGKERRHWAVAPGPRPKEAVPLCIAFSPNGSLLAYGCVDATCRVVDVTSGKEVHQFFHPPFSVCSIAFSPDGKLLAAGNHHKDIRLWDVTTGELVAIFAGHEGGVLSLAFSYDGRRLVSGSFDRTIRIWQVPTGTQCVVFRGHEGAVNAVTFSGDGKMLVSGSRDNTVRLWEVATGKERRRFIGHTAQVMSVAYSPDQKTVATGSYDTTILLWAARVSIKANRRPTENPTRQQLDALWRDLGGDPPHAFDAMCLLETVPAKSVPFFQEHLPPIVEVDRARLSQLIANLDDDLFETREEATRELEKLAYVVEPELRKALAVSTSPEMRLRLQLLLNRLIGPGCVGHCQGLRSIEVLEHIGTPEAQRLLKLVTKSPLTTRFSAEAQAALERLSKNAPLVP
jgi:hypothetical protein